jgi:hypothetical protein
MYIFMYVYIYIYIYVYKYYYLLFLMVPHYLNVLDAVEVVMAIEEEFCIEIPDSEADKILSITDAVAYISGHPMAK